MGDRWLDEAVRLRRENTPPGTSWQHAADDNARLEVTLCDECEKRVGVTAWRGHWLCECCCEEDA